MDKWEKYLDLYTEEDVFMSNLFESVFEFVRSLDIDALDENQFELLENLLMETEDDEVLYENRKISVIRGGKKVKRLEPKAGHKVVDGKYVKMSPAEKITRQKAAKESAIKRKGKQAATNKARQKSMKKRKQQIG